MAYQNTSNPASDPAEFDFGRSYKDIPEFPDVRGERWFEEMMGDVRLSGVPINVVKSAIEIFSRNFGEPRSVNSNKKWKTGIPKLFEDALGAGHKPSDVIDMLMDFERGDDSLSYRMKGATNPFQIIEPVIVALNRIAGEREEIERKNAIARAKENSKAKETAAIVSEFLV